MYDIYDLRRDYEQCGNMKKKGGGCQQCMKEMLLDLENYEVNPPSHATMDEKALLLAALMMIELQYYEDRSEDKKDGLEGPAAAAAEL